LSEFQGTFEREKITDQALRLLTESDLVEMGLPIGPRRVLLNEIKAVNFKKVSIRIGHTWSTIVCGYFEDMIWALRPSSFKSVKAFIEGYLSEILVYTNCV